MEEKKYLKIIKHYESCYQKHGDSHLGVDWPVLEDVEKRYQVMLEMILFKETSKNNVTVLDFGCGLGHFLEFLDRKNIGWIDYAGLDISEKFIEIANKKFPDRNFFAGDLLAETFEVGCYDYWIMNGVFTEKRDLNFDDMWEYFTKMIVKAFHLVKKGLAFNLMSKDVSWERDDLFHVRLDMLSKFLCQNVSRNFLIRYDYGLFEFTVYIYKK